MKKEADRLRTYDRWPVSFVNKNDMAAAGFYFMGSEDTVRCHSVESRLGCGSLEITPSGNINVGASLAGSSKGTLLEIFLAVLTTSRGCDSKY
jgi:hypothetical protein